MQRSIHAYYFKACVNYFFVLYQQIFLQKICVLFHLKRVFGSWNIQFLLFFNTLVQSFQI